MTDHDPRIEMRRRKAIYEALSWAVRAHGDASTRVDIATDRLMNELFPLAYSAPTNTTAPLL